jgi:hypothetical protein
MEQQTVSVAKAGLISTLNARTSVLACANPVGSRYNPRMTMTENINLPPTLLSRFDLIYLVLDDRSNDLPLARHLIALFHDPATAAPHGANPSHDVLPVETLRDYIAFARTRCAPRISAAASQRLVDEYANLRRMGRERKVIVATPRQLESLIRLSEAIARMHLSPEVDEGHVARAVQLWHSAMRTSCGNRDGDIDMARVCVCALCVCLVGGRALARCARRLLQPRAHFLRIFCCRPTRDPLLPPSQTHKTKNKQDAVFTGNSADDREMGAALPGLLRQLLAARLAAAPGAGVALEELLEEAKGHAAPGGPLRRPPTRAQVQFALYTLDDMVRVDAASGIVRPLHGAAA